MKRLSLVTLMAAFILWLPGCSGDSASQVPPFQTYSIEQFLASTAVGGGSFNSDESKLLVHSNASGVFNVYAIDVATGTMTQLTDSSDTTFAEAYLPQGDRFLFRRDDGGNELYKLYLQEADGTVRRLTQGDQTRELFYGFAHDQQSFFTANNSRDPRFMDVYEWPIETLEPKMVYQNKEGLEFAAISRDKRWIALVRVHTIFDSDMYLLDREGDGVPRLISDPDGEVNHFPQTFTPDGRSLLYTTDRDSDFLYLAAYDIETGRSQTLFQPEKWDVEDVMFSYQGTYRVIVVNENGTPRRHILDTRTGEDFVIPELPPGRITGLQFGRSEDLVRFYAGDADRPPDLYVHRVSERVTRRLTSNLNPEIVPEHLVRPELITLQARDGLVFYGYLYKPKEASATRKVPALLWIHGGPGGQSMPVWDEELQFIVNHGYAVFDLNYRGSGGFGRTFSKADDQRHGREPLDDCVDAKNWLASNVDWIASDKIGILGGSYGGYMVMAALAFRPEEFAVGVNIFGVTNWVRTLKSIPPWWESFRLALYRELGDPETQETMLYEISPLFFADRIVRPVLILQGANDPRVLKVESDEMVDNIRRAGGTVEYVLFDDEGHGFTKTANRVTGFNAVLRFLDHHLKGIARSTAAFRQSPDSLSRGNTAEGL